MSLAEDNEYLTSENMKLADQLHKATLQIKVHQEYNKAATELLADCGWYPLGTHANDSPVPDLIFSPQLDEGGLPLFEKKANG